MDLKLEVIPVPVSDIDRAKAFYDDQAGFEADLDVPLGEGRLVQLTPPGSGCSIHLNSAITTPPPGSLQGLTLVVDDIEAVHAELAERGLKTSPVQHFVDGEWVEGKGGDWNSFVHFSDPDGNGWVIQERPAAG